MNNKYKMSVIPQTLKKQETIVQLAEMLNHLSEVTQNIIIHLDKKLLDTENHLTTISHRINTVYNKINGLKGATTAIQVFSSSKYPASEIERDYVSVFHDCPKVELKKYPVKLTNSSNTFEPLDRLQLYHVNVSSDHPDKKLEGFGDIPHETNFVNDLQMYNSGKNLYTNIYSTNISKKEQNLEEVETIQPLSEIGAAPSSISERLSSTQSFMQDYFYAPQIGEVPALDVPSDLPDLPGVAYNLHYISSHGPGIAPSSIITTPLPEDIDDLPDIVPIKKEEEEIEIPVNLPVNLPPPPVALQNLPPAVVQSVPTVTLPSVPPALEPDMPREEPSVPVEEAKLKVEVQPPKTVVPPSDIRSSLMEAIRRAGGREKARLRSVQQEEKSSKTPQGGDLVADLHNALFMRRKGISGNKKPQENVIDATSTLEKISAMIPPPPENKIVESTSTDEDEWD